MEEVQRDIKEEAQKRQEFYDLIHENCKAEFINGEIIMHSPVKRRHWKVVSKLSAYLLVFVEKHDLSEVGNEKVLVSLTRNDYEPDICFFSKEKAQKFKLDQMRFPPPDFVVEVLSPSTAKNDRGTKFTDYAAPGMAEYWIVDPAQQTIEQYQLAGKQYQLYQQYERSGKIRSLVIEGFEVALEDIFEENH